MTDPSSQQPPQSPVTLESIVVIAIHLIVDDAPCLLVLATEDGLLNRMGDGTAATRKRLMAIGHTGEPIFTQLKSKVQDDWLRLSGTYDVPEKVGSVCVLTLSFETRAGEETGLRFLYGSRSEGPPRDIREFVALAVELTDSWYATFARRGGPRKPWWKFW